MYVINIFIMNNVVFINERKQSVSCGVKKLILVNNAG